MRDAERQGMTQVLLACPTTMGVGQDGIPEARSNNQAVEPSCVLRPYASVRRATSTGMTRVVAAWYSAYGGYAATARSHHIAFSSPVTSRAT